jgi:hypothetical protein
MAKSRPCMSPDVKKALLERLGAKCEIDESGICEIIETFPVCGTNFKRPAKRKYIPPTEYDYEEVQYYHPRPPEPEAEGWPPKRVKRPRKLSGYQKHMSVCLLANEGFDTCIQKWKAGDSMESQYKGSGMTK